MVTILTTLLLHYLREQDDDLDFSQYLQYHSMLELSKGL